MYFPEKLISGSATFSNFSCSLWIHPFSISNFSNSNKICSIKKCWFMLIIFSGIFFKKYFVNVGCASILDQSWIYSSFRLEYSFLQFADLTYHHIFQENIFDQCWIYWNGNVCIYSSIKIGNFAFLVCPNILILDWQGKFKKDK